MIQSLYMKQSHNLLTVQGLDRGQSRSEETMFREGIQVRMYTTHLCCGGHNAECAECVIQKSLVDVLVQVSDEQIRSDIKLLLVRGCLENTGVSACNEVIGKRKSGYSKDRKVVSAIEEA